MVKLGVGILITAAVLGVAAVGALRGEPVDASSLATTPDAVAPLAVQTPQESEPPVAPQEAAPEEPDGRPFIGVAVHAIGDDEADQLGIAGGVRVVRVFEGGPSDGLLLPDDIIVTVGDSDIVDVRDLLDAIKATTVGVTVSITVVRDGDILELAVEVVDRSDIDIARQAATRLHFNTGPGGSALSGILGGVMGQLRALEQSFVRAEVVLETDDGFKTVAAVKGTITELDVPGGSFTLAPKDGSHPIDYQISDDTVIGMVHSGDLGGLNIEDETLVVSVDGEVKLVQQGSLLDIGPIKGLTTILPRLGTGGPGVIGSRLPDIRIRLGDALRDLDRLKDRDGGRFLSESLLERIREALEEAEVGIADE
jgi:hypothetical protein